MLEFFLTLFRVDWMPQVLYTLRGSRTDPWLLVLMNAVIAVSHFTIAAVLLRLTARRKDLLFRSVAILIALFISFWGAMQSLAIWTIWHPEYQLGGAIKPCMTVLSSAAAIVLVWLAPVLDRLPSIADLQKEMEERRRAEEAGREKEERFRNFVESVPDYAMFMIDPEGVVQSWNLGAERIKGYTAEEIVGRHFSCFYSQEEIDAGAPEAALRMAAGGGYKQEGWRVRKNGSRFLASVILRPLYDGQGRLRGFAKIARDLTETRVMEARYRALLESAPDAILIVDADGVIQFANAQVERLYGYSREELRGQSVELLVPESLRAGHKEHRRAFGADPRPREMGAGLDLTAVRKDGSSFPVEISLSPLEGPDGISVTAAIRDVTERKHAAEQLAAKMNELRQSNQALEQFAHIASHDLQEPLRMVASYVQLLSRRYKGRLDRDADEFIEYAVDGTRRMKRLIEDLLVYSRAGKGGPPVTEFGAEAALQEALNNLRTAIEESRASVTYGSLPTVVAPDSEVVQIFQNLIGNAIKYRGDRVPEIHIAAEAGDREWIFSVADNGIGIEPQYFERIFEIFHRLHGREEYEGTGIGLAICKRILQQQGGRIWVESGQEHGSVFRFTLPAR